MRIARFVALMTGVILVTGALACGGDDDVGDDAGDDGGEPTATQEEEPSATEASDGGESTAVSVSLGEFFVVPVPASVPAGTVNFEVTNDSPYPMVPHQIVVIRTDLPLSNLPTRETGAVDEEGEEIEVLGKIATISPGNTKELSVDLEAGTYGLVCNIYKAEARTSHYQEGVYTEFTVE